MRRWEDKALSLGSALDFVICIDRVLLQTARPVDTLGGWRDFLGNSGKSAALVLTEVLV